MKSRSSFIRGLAMLLSLMLGILALPAAAEDDIPADDVVLAEAVDPEVEEAGEIALAPEAFDEPLAESPGELAVLAPEAAPAAETAETAEAAPIADVPGWTTRAVTKTQAVSSDTWKAVNLVRAGGFSGKLAAVSGTLTLDNVLIDGAAPAADDLPAHFDLGGYGGIVLKNGAKLALNYGAFSFNKGDKRTLKLTWKGKKVSGKKAKWYSSDKSVVKVSKSGKLTARKAGTARIAVKYKKNWAYCQVVVTDIKYVKSVKLNVKSKMTLALNSAVQLKAAVSPADAVDAAITWSSSNSAVCSVDQNGWISGLSGGKATITARTANGKSAKCKVKVKEIKPKSLGFPKPYVTLNPGDTAPAQAAMSPANVSNPRILYSSSDASVARIDESGQITAVGVGRSTITARAAAKTSVAASFTVIVVAPGSGRMAGLIIGLNPGHQTKTITKKYPIAPGSKKKAYGCKVGAGGRWSRVPEYEVVLQIGLKLRKKLEDAGATVVMTRTTNDVSLTNIQRAEILNKAGVDVALQLHCNSSNKKSHHGCSGFVRTTGGWYGQSKAIGKALVKGICASTGMTNKGVKKYNGYMSLNWTTTPSVLLEMGYLSNKAEDKLLATDEFREKIAQGIFDGLCAYYGR